MVATSGGGLDGKNAADLLLAAPCADFWSITMLEQIRTRLRASLEKGFWFPRFCAIIDFAYSRFSLGAHFNRWLANGGDAPKGVSELYQVVLVLIGFVWVLVVDSPIHPALTSQPLQLVGILIALYWITELFVFSLHWTFVATGELEAIRRSLATFLLNLVEIALFFAIVFTLTGCRSMTGWTAIYDSITSVFNLRLVAVQDNLCCRVAAHYEIIVAGTLLAIIIASLVGAVVRPEKHAPGP